ncbi:MAG: histidine phosphatase family protein, partial [Caldimonas sp.]
FWPAEAARWRRHDPEFSPEGGESLREFAARAVAACTRIAASRPGRSIAIVSHGGVLDCLYRAASGIALGAARSWELGNAAVNRLLYTPRGFTLVGWSDTAHLEGATLDDGSEGDAVADAATRR